MLIYTPDDLHIDICLDANIDHQQHLIKMLRAIRRDPGCLDIFYRAFASVFGLCYATRCEIL